MHELRRRSYLDAMGIPGYVSRGAAPAAAPSRKLLVVRDASTRGAESRASLVERVSLPEVASPEVRSRPPISSIDILETPKTAVADTTPAAVPAANQTQVAPAGAFSISAFTAGGWLWLEERPTQQPLMQDQIKLIRAMCVALGWGAEQPGLTAFDWPIHTNSQLDLGEEAARASLGGFVMRKLEKENLQGIVVLGDGCNHWLPRAEFPQCKIVTTLSTLDLVNRPQLKKQAWQDLQPFAS